MKRQQPIAIKHMLFTTLVITGCSFELPQVPDKINKASTALANETDTPQGEQAAGLPTKPHEDRPSLKKGHKPHEEGTDIPRLHERHKRLHQVFVEGTTKLELTLGDVIHVHGRPAAQNERLGLTVKEADGLTQRQPQKGNTPPSAPPPAAALTADKDKAHPNRKGLVLDTAKATLGHHEVVIVEDQSGALMNLAINLVEAREEEAEDGKKGRAKVEIIFASNAVLQLKASVGQKIKIVDAATQDETSPSPQFVVTGQLEKRKVHGNHDHQQPETVDATPGNAGIIHTAHVRPGTYELTVVRHLQDAQDQKMTLRLSLDAPTVPKKD